MKIAIIGAGDLGVQLAHYIQSEHNIVGFFDDTKSGGTIIEGVPVLGGLKEVESSFQKGIFDKLVLAIGYRHLKKRAEIFMSMKGVIPFMTYVHPTSWVDPSCRLGEGSVVLPGCLLDRNVRVGENSFVNIGCAIAHDTEVGAHSFLAPRVSLAGFCKLGDYSFLGIGTIFKDNIKSCDNVQTGAGAVVCQDLLSPGLYVGLPAKMKKVLVK